jgi:NAD(P)-dependent dehydrogenase (short-subunit alcohol dehydrogenase family)
MMAPVASRPGGNGIAGRLDGKVAIVTGAGSRGPGVGNGEATAILFAREGARVLCVDQEGERAERTCAAIAAEGGETAPFVADVTSRAHCADMVGAALTRYGRLDVLHNNVGIVSSQGVRDVTEDEWDRVMAVNLKSMLLAAQAALPALEAAGGGAITNVASIGALRSLGPAATAYTTSKAGVVGLTIALAGQLGEKRIRVNCIAPRASLDPAGRRVPHARGAGAAAGRADPGRGHGLGRRLGGGLPGQRRGAVGDRAGAGGGRRRHPDDARGRPRLRDHPDPLRRPAGAPAGTTADARSTTGAGDRPG